MNTDKDELRIKVAVLCGWRDVQQGTELCEKWWHGKPIGVPPCNQGADTLTAHSFWELPDYCNDLNACHEFEEHITDLEKRNSYFKTLIDICCEFPGTDVISANAEQRCRAFVKTMEVE